MTDPRFILHVDMDAFFAAIVQLDQPELRGKPILVGHDGPRGVVTTASYEARPFGCRSAMPMAEAKRRCPEAIVVPVPGERVREMSGKLFEVLHQFSPLVEGMSVDEAFVDLTGTERLLGPPPETAARILASIHDELELTASGGLAPNKFLAKLASDENKPNGLTLVPFDDVAGWLATKPISRMWGIGRVGEKRMLERGITTIGDLQNAGEQWLADWFGNDAEHYRRLSRGIDDRPVVPEHEAKSIGHEQTFGENLTHPDHVRAVMLDQSEQVGWRLRRHGFKAGRVTVKIRFGQFETITRSRTLGRHTDVTGEIWEAAKGLFDEWAGRSFRPVRLIGVTAGALSQDEGQLDLFGQSAQQRSSKVDQLTDQIVDRFGKRAIRRAGGLRGSSDG